MEKIGDILEKVFEDYEKNFMNNKNIVENGVYQELSDIIQVDNELKSVEDTRKLINKKKQMFQSSIIVHLRELLLNYGEFKRIPEYYKIISGKAQEYIFINMNGKEIRGIRILEKNMYYNNGFKTKELYLLEDGMLCEFSSQMIDKISYKECFRELECEVEQPLSEEDFLALLQRIKVIMAIRLDQIKKINDFDKKLVVLLEALVNNLEEIIKV